MGQSAHILVQVKMNEGTSKIEICKDKGKEILQTTGKKIVTVLTLGKVKDELSDD